ncbi:uncharacterized protein C630.12 isoform X1 [Rhododendron vialii]|uniref:uncharacterized protein C630.12 isoform X1 n=1 Tax=Rhododendron vialii TaxID=182163 RepID=UPI00265DEBB4|nr:uncharacterized protein C630.12 isoform X1 [Rhododendron vialii]
MWNLTVVLCVIWAATLLYGEMFAFWVPSFLTCSWPHHLRHRSPSSSISGAEFSSEYVKVAVLTDPQVMDRTSLRLAPKSLALESVQFYTDLFMRRAILASVLPFQPDVILFLGDYLDGGPILSDKEWQESLSRFKHIFNLNMLERSAKTQVYYLPGNHDIGYAAIHSRMPEVIKRYEKEFGSRNYQFTVGKVDFIAIDAQTLDGPSQGHLTAATWDFVKNISKDVSLTPRVLLTHIPLYRPDWTSCGPHRSSPVINQRVSRDAETEEILYQNYVTKKSSKSLLEMVKPVLILSGHDHDQCTVSHLSKYGQVAEHTLGTISWQQGNLYPSFMLLSVSNQALDDLSSKEDAILTHLCFLPMQTHIYIWYICQFVLTLLVLLLWPTNGIDFSRHFRGFMGYIRSLSCSIFGDVTKEKNDDENCEYEMIWDAEGSMHLIKKTSKAPTKLSSDKGVVESRGNAVIRPAAKKHISPEMDVSVSVDMNVPLIRTNKSKTKMVIRRLVRIVRTLIVVAAVNVPLYMMLLFKDWIDK